jgi:MerR family mercuric resistance operon transcriptional regulator
MINTTIAGLARIGGVGVETIRFYQRQGLLDLPERTGGKGPGSKARRYGEKDVCRLRFIRSAKAAGFTLKQIKELLRLDAEEDWERARMLAKERIAALTAKIAELEIARNSLRRLVRECGAIPSGPCPIITAFKHE